MDLRRADTGRLAAGRVSQARLGQPPTWSGRQQLPPSVPVCSGPAATGTRGGGRQGLHRCQLVAADKAVSKDGHGIHASVWRTLAHASVLSLYTLGCRQCAALLRRGQRMQGMEGCMRVYVHACISRGMGMGHEKPRARARRAGCAQVRPAAGGVGMRTTAGQADGLCSTLLRLVLT